MTDLPILPDWVLIEAAKRCGWTGDVPLLQTYYENDRPYRALCDMIAKHEQKPFDRKLLCAREAAALARDVTPRAAQNYIRGGYDKWDAVQLGIRAIELYEKGFGK